MTKDVHDEKLLELLAKIAEELREIREILRTRMR